MNASDGDWKNLYKYFKKAIRNTLAQLEKRLKIVSKNLNRTDGLAIGMGAFGIPFSVALELF